MSRKMPAVAAAILLFALGWVAAGMAQGTRPDFELIVDAPGGGTTIECIRGCNLAWIGRGVTNEQPIPQFRYSCGGDRCNATVGGWIIR
jgi:hypothetical protein